MNKDILKKFVLAVLIIGMLINSSELAFGEIEGPVSINVLTFPLTAVPIIAIEHMLVPAITNWSLVNSKNEKSNYWGTFKGSLYFALPYLGVSLYLFQNTNSEQGAYRAAGYVLMQILGGIWGNKNL
jgi:hypothetical protein